MGLFDCFKSREEREREQRRERRRNERKVEQDIEKFDDAIAKLTEERTTTPIRRQKTFRPLFPKVCKIYK